MRLSSFIPENLRRLWQKPPADTRPYMEPERTPEIVIAYPQDVVAIQTRPAEAPVEIPADIPQAKRHRLTVAAADTDTETDAGSCRAPQDDPDSKGRKPC